MTILTARILNPGEAEAPVLRLTEPLSFWGSFDPLTGRIVDVHHPEHGAVLSGRILVMAESRGSGSAPGGIAEAIRLGTAPAGIVLGRADVNLAMGSLVAAILYGKACPVVALDEPDFARAASAARLAIRADGTVALA